MLRKRGRKRNRKVEGLTVRKGQEKKQPMKVRTEPYGQEETSGSETESRSKTSQMI